MSTQMLDRYGLAASTGRVHNTKNFGPVLAAQGSIFVLFVMLHGEINFKEDGRAVVVPKPSELPGMGVKKFYLLVWSLSVKRGPSWN